MLKEITLRELTPSPTNPRKTFDQVKLHELARSIGEVGVLEPILVRAHVNGATTYEVVAGERRYRAAAIANVETVPCIIRELTDVQVLEIQTIENLQRDDLHPLEEAEGYAALMKQAGYDVAAIAQKISKSEKYVYDRVKLLQLIPELRTCFLDGEITAGHAILLARLKRPDQERCLGSGPGGLGQYSFGGGLFVPEHYDVTPGLDLDDKRKRKAVSVRELDTWINDNVRFHPSEVDLPNLFPETAAALATAEEEELKVIKITRDHQLRVEARDEEGERTYARRSWKRADGGLDAPDGYGKPKPSKPCVHSVMGVVVAGPGRAEAFRVCVAKKKCKVHWAAEIKEAEKRQNGTSTSSSPSKTRDSYEEQERKRREQYAREQAEKARWEKARPKLLEQLAEKLGETPALDLVDVILKKCRPYGGNPPKQLERGTTVEDALRYLAFVVVAGEISSTWNPGQQVPPVLKPYGIDARKIVDQVAPKPKPEKAKAEAQKKDGRKAAGGRAAAAAKKKRKLQTAAEAT